MRYTQRNFHRNFHLGRTQRQSRRRSGSVIVEFAMVAPILIFLLLGIVQYGLIAQATAVTTNLSREGARLGSISTRKTNANIADHVRAMADGTSVRASDLAISISPSTRTLRQPITVRVTYNMRSRAFLAGVPGIGWMLQPYRSGGGDPMYTATATMSVLSTN